MSGRLADAAALLDIVLADPPGKSRSLHFDRLRVLRAELAADPVAAGGDPADAEPYLEPYKAPPRKVLGTGLDSLQDHYRIGRLHARAGDHERARLYYLAAAPPADDAAAMSAYMLNGVFLGSDLHAAGRAEEAVNFQLNLIKKHPEAAAPSDLHSAMVTASLNGMGEVADAVGDILVAGFPDAPQTAWALNDRGRRALLAGDRAKAIDAFKGVYQSPAASSDDRVRAARRLNMLGESVRGLDGRPIRPRPDPISTRPSE